MTNNLKGFRAAILVADGFELVELTEPREALEGLGAQTTIVSPAKGKVQGWNHDEKADKFEVDVPLDEARFSDYDALLLPGGVRNPDILRTIPRAVEFVKGFFRPTPVLSSDFPPPLFSQTDLPNHQTN